MISRMKKILLLCFVMCIFQKYLFLLKKNIRVPKNFFIITFELEQFQIEYIYYVNQ